MHTEARSPIRNFDEFIESSDQLTSLHDGHLDRVPPAHGAAHVAAQVVTEAGVEILLCPGPRFAGTRATRFAHSASPVCQARRFIVLDMSEVAAVDAPGLLAITSLARICRSAGGVLRLCSPNQVVRGLLAAVGMHRLVDVFHTRQQASLV